MRYRAKRHTTMRRENFDILAFYDVAFEMIMSYAVEIYLHRQSRV